MQRFAFTALAFLAACGSGTTSRPAQQDPMPDFALRDENPTSQTHTAMVSPRQYLGQVSAYYFGSAL